VRPVVAVVIVYVIVNDNVVQFGSIKTDGDMPPGIEKETT
jgi:hypothetical protein